MGIVEAEVCARGNAIMGLTNRWSRRRAGVLPSFYMIKTIQSAATLGATRRSSAPSR